MDHEARKRVLRSVPYGLYALGVAGGAGEAPHGALVAWLTQVSFEPPMIAVALERESRTRPLVRRAGAFAVTVLPVAARALASRLGRPTDAAQRTLVGVAHHPAPSSGAPVFDEGMGWLDCRLRGETPAGDHVLVVADVVDAGVLREGETLTLATTGWRYAG